jgi:hypothetical protein
LHCSIAIVVKAKRRLGFEQDKMEAAVATLASTRQLTENAHDRRTKKVMRLRAKRNEHSGLADTYLHSLSLSVSFTLADMPYRAPTPTLLYRWYDCKESTMFSCSVQARANRLREREV